jgi:hypothetical protein
MDFGSVKNVWRAVTFAGPVTLSSNYNIEPQTLGCGVYMEFISKFFCGYFNYFLLSSLQTQVFPTIVGSLRVALIQSEEAPVEPAEPLAYK